MRKIDRQMDFIIEIDKLKNVFRQSLISDGSRHENDAEHSWHLCMLAITLEEYAEEGTDILKCIKMALIHDIVEIYAGDTYLYDEEGNKDKSEREMKSAEKIYGLLDESQKNEFLRLWREFDEGETKEAVFANILDRIQPITLNYLTKGEMWIKNGIRKEQVLNKAWRVFKLAHPDISEYMMRIIDESVKKGYLMP
ncbi:MAG: HD domain-containing protein [Clostridiales bacterium]|nr:HD domain-containing protein [Clostridiales bacterium]